MMSSASALTLPPAPCCPPNAMARRCAACREWRANPHAWVKLWKHHAAQPEADRVNQIAAEMGETWLPRYGGKISSEWFFPKALQILNEAPDVYAAADRMLEAADWVIWQLTGIETRNTCTAGYKAHLDQTRRLPQQCVSSRRCIRGFEHVVDQKMMRDLTPIGARAGVLDAAMAELMGLRAGTAVAVANVDAHVSVPACQGDAAGHYGQHHGHQLVRHVAEHTTRPWSRACAATPKMAFCRVLRLRGRAKLRGRWLSAGLSRTVCHHSITTKPKAKRQAIHQVLEAHAAKLQPGESGLLALDWWNGNRSILVDANLSGVYAGHDVGDDRAGDVPGVDRGDGLWQARDRRDLSSQGRADSTRSWPVVACRRRTSCSCRFTADVVGLPIKVSATLCKHQRWAVPCLGRWSREGHRRLRFHRRCSRAHGPPERRSVYAQPSHTSRLTMRCMPNMFACTTTLGAMRTAR